MREIETKEKLILNSSKNTKIEEEKKTEMEVDQKEEFGSKPRIGFSSYISNIKNRWSPLFRREKNKLLTHSEKWKLFEKANSKKKRIHMNTFKYIKLKFKNFFNLNIDDEERLFLKAEKVFHEEIDITHLLRKIQDIDKLKYLLLTREQALLLKFIEKPVIFLDDLKDHNNFVISDKLTDNELKEVFNFYSELECNGYSSDLEKKLMNMVGKRIKDFSNFS